jgi:hypothetical protein
MTDLFAHESVLSLALMFGMFGMILFGANAASTLQAERIKEANKAKRKTKKKQTVGRTKPKRRRDHSTLMGESSLKGVKKQGRKAKAAEARPLSEFNQGIYDKYKLGFDFPNFKATSSIPL